MRYLIFCLVMLPCATFGSILTSTGFITGIPGVTDIGSFEVSPDGRHLYAISNAENLLAAFAIDDVTGSLTSIDTETTGIPIDGGTLRSRLRLSPNGAFVYVTASNSNAITLYMRDSQSGELTLITENAVQIPAGLTVNDITISPDGLNLYAITLPPLPFPGFASTIYTYDIDAQNGALSLQQSITMLEARNFAGFFSPAGNHFYIAEQIFTGNNVFFINFNLFNRDTQGNLTAIGDSQATIFNPTSLIPAINSDGSRFYLLHSIESDPPSGLLTMLERDAVTGRFINETTDSASRRNLSGDDTIKLIDNDRLLVADNPLQLYRIPASGGHPLLLEDQISNSTGASLNSTQPALAVSTDQQFLYVASGDGIVIFRIEPLALGDIPEVPSLNSYGLSVLILMLLLMTGRACRYQRPEHPMD